MRFTEWLRIDELTSMSQIDSYGVELEKTSSSSFNYATAKSQSEEQVDPRDIDYESHGAHYEDAKDDPDFSGVDVEAWEEENPEPESESYESEDDWREAHSDWKDERKRVAFWYKKEVEDWEQEMEEKSREAVKSEVKRCVSDKKEAWVSRASAYEHTFEYGGEEYHVSLEREEREIEGKEYEGIWGVSFSKMVKSGMSGYGLTGSSGSGGTAVYGKVLAAVKKLLETEKVEGLEFTGAHAYMDIMYDRFMRTFGGFTPVGDNIYMRDEMVDRDSRLLVKSGKATFEQDKNIERIKSVKILMRKAMSMKPQIVGKVVGYSSNLGVLPAVVTNVGVDGVTILVCDDKRKIVFELLIDLRNLLSRLVDPKTIPHGLVGGMVGFYNLPEIEDPNMKEWHSDLKTLLHSRGITRLDGSTTDAFVPKDAGAETSATF